MLTFIEIAAIEDFCDLLDKSLDEWKQLRSGIMFVDTVKELIEIKKKQFIKEEQDAGTGHL